MSTKYIICDIDGTLSDTTHRQHFMTKKPKDWKTFLKGMVDDPPIEATVSLLRMVWSSNSKPDIVLVSGRSEDYRKVTLRWLTHHRIPFDQLYMRFRKDNRSDYEVKKDILTNLRQIFRCDPLFVIDDRRIVVDMWRAEGLICYQIQDMPEF